MIRVLSLGSADRTLLKGFTGAVTDLAFAHLDSTLLGCVDEAGNLVIWQLTSSSGKIQYPPQTNSTLQDGLSLLFSFILLWFLVEQAAFTNTGKSC